MNRRDFIAGAAMAGAAMTMTKGADSQTKSTIKKAKLNISSQDGIIPGNSLEEKLEKMQKWGFQGIEFGGGGLGDRVKSIQKAMANSPLKVSAICAGFSGALISEQESERKKCIDSCKVILDAAGQIGSTGLIIVPAFNGQTKLSNQEGRKILIDLYPELGEYAKKCGTRMLLEPLNRGECFFLRQLADGASICRDSKNEGCCMMGDFYHMYIEETNDMGAFISAGSFLHHVHLASIKRNLPGQDERDYTDGFRGLKHIGYQDYCSFECGVIGNREEEIPKAVQFLRGQWAKAV